MATISTASIQDGLIIYADHPLRIIDALSGVSSSNIIINSDLIQGSLSNTADGSTSHAQGDTTSALGQYSHAEGLSTTAQGDYSHAEGKATTANGIASHAEGDSTIATGDYSHAEGNNSDAQGNYSHAEGSGTIAVGDYSHAEGLGTIATADYQLAVGQYNKDSNSTDYFVVGSGSGVGARADALGVNAAGTYVSSALFLPTLSSASQNSILTINSASGRVHYTASSAFTAANALTASYAFTASQAATASFVTSSNVYGPYGSNSILSASYAVSASQTISASYAVSASQAVSSSYAISASQATSASYAVTASYALNTISASYATTASYVLSSSYAITASYALNGGVTSVTGNGIQVSPTTGNVVITATPTNTGSLLTTASAALNVVTFTKGDGSTFNVTIDTGSGGTGVTQIQAGTNIQVTNGTGPTATITNTLSTGSLLRTASMSSNVMTFTKGDGSTFGVTILSASYAPTNGNVLVTASNNSNDASIEFTKADSSTFAVTVNNVQNAASASYVATASYVVSASYAATSSFVLSSSYATTASYALNGGVTSVTGVGIQVTPTTGNVVITATPTDTGSLLRTASISLNTLTFTKGDGSQFNLTVDTGSSGGVGTITQIAAGAGIQVTNGTGPIATVTNTLSTGSLLRTASVSLNTVTFTKGDGSTFNLTIDTGSSGGSGVTQINAGAGIQVTNGSGPTATITSTLNTGSLLTTASMSPTSNVMTFTKGDGSQFTVNISSASYATTASYALNGGVTSITGVGIQVSPNSGNVTITATPVNTGSLLRTASVALNTITFTKGDGSQFNITVDTGSGGGGSGVTQITAGSGIQVTNGTGPNATITNTLSTGSLLKTASMASNVMTFTKGDNSTFDVTILSASYAPTQGNVLVTASNDTNNASIEFTKADSSTFAVTVNNVQNATSALTASYVANLLKTASVASNTITFTKGNGDQFSITVDTGSGGGGSITQISAGAGIQVTNGLGPNTTITNTLSTGSLLITASSALNSLTFTKGDGSTFNVNIDTGLGGYVTTSSFNTYTSSVDSFITGINTWTGSTNSQFGGTASYVSLTAGPGITINGLEITASVRSVNGSFPGVDGNISSALTQTTTGTSASLVISSSGTPTASLADGLVWVISGDPNPSNNGDSFIWSSGSQQWYPLATLDQASGDARYLMRLPQAPLSGNLDLGGFNITNIGTATASIVNATTINAPSITGSLFGTASWAVSASQAITSSFSRFAITASNVLVTNTGGTTVYPLHATSAGAASPGGVRSLNTSGVTLNTTTRLMTITSSWAQSASVAISASRAITSSFTLSSSFATTASFTLSSSFATTASYVLSSSYALSSSFATSASYVLSSSYAVSASYVLSSSYAVTASAVRLQDVLDYNRELTNGNNYQGTGAGTGNIGTNVIALGASAAQNNTGSNVIALGASAASSNQSGSNVVAIGSSAAAGNTKSSVIAIGSSTGGSNTGASLLAIGDNAGQSNSGTGVIAIGAGAAQSNNQQYAIGIGVGALQNNSGSNAISLGFQAGAGNKGTQLIAMGSQAGAGNIAGNVIAIGAGAALNQSGSSIIAFGNNAGASNTLSGQTIFASANIPQYANWTAASASINAAAGASSGCVYLYYDTTNKNIGAVVIP